VCTNFVCYYLVCNLCNNFLVSFLHFYVVGLLTLELACSFHIFAEHRIMAHWFHRNPFKATAVQNFDVRKITMKSDFTKVVRYHKCFLKLLVDWTQYHFASSKLMFVRLFDN